MDRSLPTRRPIPERVHDFLEVYNPFPEEKLRAQGLRPIQIWVPDTTSPNFAAEAHRQSLAAARSDHAKDDQAFIDSISELPDW